MSRVSRDLICDLMALTAGVDLGGTKVLAALVDDSGAIVARAAGATDTDAGTASLLSALKELLDGAGETPDAIGVAIAAWVEYPAGRVAFAPNLDYELPNVLEVVRDRFGLPTVVENDANAAAWGEREFGAGKGYEDMLMLTLGTGIGGGIIAGGRLYRGSLGFAAEFGHMTIVEGGPQCACGQRGCLEALASGTAIGRMAREGIGAAGDSIVIELAADNPARITGALVAEAARADDEFAIGVLERAGRSLGVGLANLVLAFDPEVIVIGGSVAGVGYYLLEPARLELDARISGRRKPPQILTASLGNDAGVIGVAALARAGA